MGFMSRAPLDLAVLADNGLRRGRTTGTCATAAFKAALQLILRQEVVAEVRVSLPDSRSEERRVGKECVP